MEAKDTVKKIMAEAEMRADRLAEDSEGHFKQEDIEGIYEDAYWAIFRAGRREVVDWINSNWYYASRGDMYLHGDKWQSRLKEWGIKEDK